MTAHENELVEMSLLFRRSINVLHSLWPICYVAFADWSMASRCYIDCVNSEKEKFLVYFEARNLSLQPTVINCDDVCGVIQLG